MLNPQKVLTLIDVLLELEDLASVENPTEIDLKDEQHALRQFSSVFKSLVLECLDEKK